MSRPAQATPPAAAVAIPLAMIHRSLLNPRRVFGADQLCELAASIQTHGVLQPILVRPVGDHYEIVAGERRWRAAQEAGLHAIPATIREMDDRTAVEIAVLENVQREALMPLEEADGFAALVRHDWTQEQIAARVGKSRAYVGNRLAIADAGDAVRGALEEGRISASVALVLARAPEAQRAEALERLHERPSVDAALRVVAATSRRLAEAPFDVADASLCPASGACGDCPRRSGAEASLFAIDDDVCLDAECWRRKCGVDFTRRAAQHKGKVLTADDAAKVFDDWGGVDLGSGYTDRADEASYFDDDRTAAAAAAALAKLPVALAQNPHTGATVELLDRKAADAIRRKHFKVPGAKTAATPKVSEAQKAAEAERKRCENVGEALVLAAIADRKNAAALLVALGTHDFQDDYSKGVLAVAGLTKQSSLDAWARKATKDDLAAFLLAERLENATCYLPDQVRALAARLDLPVPEGFAEAPKPRGKRGAK